MHGPERQKDMRIPNSSRRAVAVAALVLVAAACGDDAAPAVSPAVELAGRTFLSTGASTFDIVDGTTIRVTFEADRIGVDGGCNSIGGPYSITDGVLETDELASTMMACDDALMDQDQRLTTLLTSRPTIVVDEGTVTIGDGPDQLVLEEQQPAELEGTVWSITGVISGDAVSSVPDGATIVFVDGEVRFDSGCNTGFGTAEISGDVIDVGPVASTKMGCPDDLAALEAAITSVLQGAVSAQIDGTSLTLTSGDVGLTLAASA
jgi:heat shock protein HslJ